MPAGTKEIRRRLHSVKNTKKITYAMKLVSAAKLRRAQESVTRSREYTNAIQILLAELLSQIDATQTTHPLMEAHHDVKKVRLLIAGGSRGLCGGYNTNVNKRIEAAYQEIRTKHPGAEIDAVILGKKPAEYFRRTQKNYSKSYEALSEDANVWPIDEVCREIETNFVRGEVDEVYLLFTHFKSAMSMTVRFDKLLPMDASTLSATHTGSVQSGVTLFEPSVREVFSAVIPRILRSRVRQACLDAKASEQASRMTAMDAATKNAGELIKKLELKYNKLRQSGITSELLDIIGGAEALN